MATVSFTVNACVTDQDFFGPTLRHVLRTFDYPFVERLVAFDPGRPDGKYLERNRGNLEGMQTLLSALQSEGWIDRCDEIPWGEAEQHRILTTHFATADMDLRDFSGAPIYQYLYALDRCQGDYILHIDSDMLFHRGSDWCWIEAGIEFMERTPDAAMVTVRGGPPIAGNWLERLLDRPLKTSPQGWKRCTTMSTRYFLLHKARWRDRLLPLVQHKPGEPLEDSISHTLGERGLGRWTSTGTDSWSIHPWKHDAAYVEHLPLLIRAVEAGVYPFKRTGYPWDMRTEDGLVEEWLGAIRRHGLTLPPTQ